VILSAGETHQELNDLRAQVWDFVQPQEAISRMLADDLVSIHWRLRRPHRCETAEIRRLRDTAVCRLRFEKISQIASLKSRFLQSLAALCSPALAPTDVPTLILSMEEARKELQQKSLGLHFLIGLVESTSKRVDKNGYLSPLDENVLVNACGVGNTCAQACLMLNQIAKAEMKRFEEDESSDRSTFEVNKQIMSIRLTTQIGFMKANKQVVEIMESIEEKAYLASLVMPPAERSEQIYRVEAALSRRFYKTLGLILALKGIELPQ
jgi:hypothetical protein